MNRRTRPVQITDHPEHRSIPIERVELRDGDDDNIVYFSGYASTFESYEMYGGPANGGWIEQIARGAFDKTLREKPDLMFLINHEGMPLARTKSGTCRLTVDDHGLRVDAELDRRDSDVRNLEIKMQRGDMDEMSFAFRVKAQEWRSTADFPDDDMALRTITEVSLHKGDVSIVNYGANPTTSASVRSVEEALKVIAECDDRELAEIRSDSVDTFKIAQERLAAVRSGFRIDMLPTGTVLDGALRSVPDEDAVRAWLDAEKSFVESWLEAERQFVQSWLDAEKEFVEREGCSDEDSVSISVEDFDRPIIYTRCLKRSGGLVRVELSKPEVVLWGGMLDRVRARYRETDPDTMRCLDENYRNAIAVREQSKGMSLRLAKALEEE